MRGMTYSPSLVLVGQHLHHAAVFIDEFHAMFAM